MISYIKKRNFEVFSIGNRNSDITLNIIYKKILNFFYVSSLIIFFEDFISNSKI